MKVFYKRKPQITSALSIVLFAALLLSLCPTRALSASPAQFDYSSYQQFLDRYVVQGKSIGGIKLSVIDYESIQQDRKKPNSLYERILKQLATFDPRTLRNTQEQKAFWINTYNIGAIKMIVDYYPVDSIRSRKINWFRNPWALKILTIGNETYSLGQIEHEILIGNYQDPLIHFAIVCASVSCPDLNPQVYRGDRLQRQLERRARHFLLNRKKGLWIRKEQNEVFFSQIFRFDEKSFANGAKDAVPLIVRFIDDNEDREYVHTGNYKIRYLDYNWDLNTLKNSR